MKRTLVALIVALGLVGAPALADGQSGVVQGTVVDTSGAPIANASVTLVGAFNKYPAVTDAKGAFSLDSVPAGEYEVVALAHGFQPVRGRIVEVNGGVTETVSIVMTGVSIGAMSSLGTVRVNSRQALSTASAPTVELDPQDLAGQGVEQLSQILAQQIALTMTRPAGGAPGLPQTASLRGPDPSETLIDVDGQRVNNSGTGDFDLELLDPGEFSNVQVVYGIGPSSLVGANTQGGVINFHTINPTPQDQALLRFSAGSFDTFGETAQATGTTGQWGYALSYHRFTTAGEVNGYPVENGAAGPVVDLGSNIDATAELAKVRYSFGTGDAFAEVTYRNIIAFRNISGPLSTPLNNNDTAQGAPFSAVPDANIMSIAPAFGFDVQVPVGQHGASGIAPATVIVRHLTDTNAQSVPADVEAVGNPYLINQYDHVYDDSLEYDRTLDNGSLTLSWDVRTETLDAPFDLAIFGGPQTQSKTERSYLASYELRASRTLHFTAGTYLSRFDTFGTSVDPRFAVVWTPSADQVFRASIGTGFRPPLLAERVYNPDLTAERTTEYELGYERRFSDDPLAAHAVLNLYRTNLRDPIFFTVGPTGAFNYLKNLSDVVYQGIELRLEKPLTQRLTVSGAFGVSIAYPINNPFAFDPAAPNVVANEQFQGIPPQKAQLSLQQRAGSSLGFWASGAYESINNEINQPAYWSFGAGVTKIFDRTQVTLAGTNLTNQFDSKFTLPGGGPLYGTPSGPVHTNAYALQGRSVNVTVTQRL